MEIAAQVVVQTLPRSKLRSSAHVVHGAQIQHAANGIAQQWSHGLEFAAVVADKF